MKHCGFVSISIFEYSSKCLYLSIKRIVNYLICLIALFRKCQIKKKIELLRSFPCISMTAVLKQKSRAVGNGKRGVTVKCIDPNDDLFCDGLIDPKLDNKYV